MRENSPTLERTTGSLAEQLANAVPPIVALRQASDGGAEALACASLIVRSWTPEHDATFVLVRDTLRAQLDPGSEAEVERATEEVARAALLTREDVRDAIVAPLIEPAVRDISRYAARGVAQLRVQNVRSFVESVVRQTLERIDHLDAQLKAAIEPLYGPERLLKAIDDAVASSSQPLSRLLAALERLRARAVDEPERIDHDVADATAALDGEQETLTAWARETSDANFFERRRALDRLSARFSTVVPKLGGNRVSLLYLPRVRAGMPAVARALDDRIGKLRARQDAATEAMDRLHAMARDEEGREAASGRVVVVGAPMTQAARDAATDKLVAQAGPSVARTLRDLAMWQAPVVALLRELRTAAAAAAAEHVPKLPLDDVLLKDADPNEVAMWLDRLIEGARVPVALTADADRRFLGEHRAAVLQVAASSRVPAVLAEHAGYRPDRFDTTGTPDRLTVLLLQPGLDLKCTAAFQGTRAAYEDEVSDPTAPPLHVLSDRTLRDMARKPENEERVGEDEGS